MKNINFTRIAYDIERVVNKEFANNRDLTYHDLKRNKNVLENAEKRLKQLTIKE